MTLAEILKAANIAEDVIAGLPAEVASAVETHLTSADTKLQSAEETLRAAGVKEKQVQEYVAKYGQDLTKVGDLKAQNEALVNYMKGLKSQGFDGIEIPDLEKPGDKKPVTATAYDDTKLRQEFGSTLTTVFKLNNEHIRLYGQPLPDDLESLVAEAKSHNYTNVAEYAEKKYKFQEKRAELSANKEREREEAIRKEEREKVAKEYAQRNGNNPNLRPGQNSNSSLIPASKPEDFHAADVNVPRRQRNARMLDRIHKDIAAANGAA